MLSSDDGHDCLGNRWGDSQGDQLDMISWAIGQLIAGVIARTQFLGRHGDCKDTILWALDNQSDINWILSGGRPQTNEVSTPLAPVGFERHFLGPVSLDVRA